MTCCTQGADVLFSPFIVELGDDVCGILLVVGARLRLRFQIPVFELRTILAIRLSMSVR